MRGPQQSFSLDDKFLTINESSQNCRETVLVKEVVLGNRSAVSGPGAVGLETQDYADLFFQDLPQFTIDARLYRALTINYYVINTCSWA